MESTGELGFLSKISPDEMRAILEQVDRHVRESLAVTGEFHRLATEAVRSEHVNEALQAVTAKTGATPENAMVMALTLYEVAIDAMRQGQRLVLVDKDYRFVREVTGLLQETPEASSHEKVAG